MEGNPFMGKWADQIAGVAGSYGWLNRRISRSFIYLF